MYLWEYSYNIKQLSKVKIILNERYLIIIIICKHFANLKHYLNINQKPILIRSNKIFNLFWFYFINNVL
jgi:hypothetical protein